LQEDTKSLPTNFPFTLHPTGRYCKKIRGKLYYFGADSLATDRLYLAADMAALIYKCRWQVEIFFRSFKHIPGCRHLLSYCDNGVELQTYAAIIACLLIALYTGCKPTKRTYEMFRWYFSGWADEDELTAHIEQLSPFFWKAVLHKSS